MCCGVHLGLWLERVCKEGAVGWALMDWSSVSLWVPGQVHMCMWDRGVRRKSRAASRQSCGQISLPAPPHPHTGLHPLLTLDILLRAPAEAIWVLSFFLVLLPKSYIRGTARVTAPEPCGHSSCRLSSYTLG